MALLLLFPRECGRPGNRKEADMEGAVEDFDIPQNKLAESAERVVDRALDLMPAT